MKRPKKMRITFDGTLPRGIFAKDLILHLIGRHGVAAGAGFAVEYAGSAIRALPIEARMTICNMSVEFGARMGLIARRRRDHRVHRGPALRAAGRRVGPSCRGMARLRLGR